MDDRDVLAERFEQHRPHLRAVAYRMLGSMSDVDDAVQEAWLRLGRTDAAAVDNLGGWLTTVVGRICLDKLRWRTARREDPLEVFVPDPIVSAPDAIDPEQEVMLADSIGLDLLVVLEMLEPAERLAFVLHDMFALPFEEIAPIVDRTPEAARQLASRARRRLQGTAAEPEVDIARQREVVDAFLAASRGGDFDALLALLDPDVVLRVDTGPSAVVGPSRVVRGDLAVAGQAITYSRFSEFARPALVNGMPGIVTIVDGRAVSVMALITRDDLIVAMDILADPERLASIDVKSIP